jgi:hypothetical protein
MGSVYSHVGHVDPKLGPVPVYSKWLYINLVINYKLLRIQSDLYVRCRKIFCITSNSY